MFKFLLFYLTTQQATDREKWVSEGVLPLETRCFLVRLFFLPQPFFFRGDLYLHLLNEFGQQPLAFFSGLCIDIAGVFFTVRPDGRVAAFPEMIVDLADTAGAWFAALPLVWLKGAGSRFSGSNFRFCLWRFTPNPQVDLCSRCPLHLVCHMGVNVQRGAAGHMTDDGRESLYIHAVL